MIIFLPRSLDHLAPDNFFPKKRIEVKNFGIMSDVKYVNGSDDVPSNAVFKRA